MRWLRRLLWKRRRRRLLAADAPADTGSVTRAISAAYTPDRLDQPHPMFQILKSGTGA